MTSGHGSSLRPKYVLIVDDDADAREMLGELIGALGHHPLKAASAREAVACAEATKLDVALIDLGLPGADGYEVARRIRGTLEGAGVRLVALTGYSDEASRRSALDAGFDEFLVKPAATETIAAVVNGPGDTPAP